MEELKEIKLYGTCSSGGALTVNATTPVFGRLYAIRYIDTSFAVGADSVISTQNHDAAATLLTITDGNASATYYPREQVHGNTGTGLTLDGTRINADLPLMAGVPRFVVSDGGNAGVGGVILFYFED